MNTIGIVGAGNAGLFAALTIKKLRPGLSVYVVGSPEVPIVGVGESSTEHFDNFRKILGLNPKDIVKECYATLKYGVYFEGWKKDYSDYLHALTKTEVTIHGEPYGYYGIMDNSDVPLEMANKWMVPPKSMVDSSGTNFPKQYHFDTFKLNQFLIRMCKQLGIVVYEDHIVDTSFADDGRLLSIQSKENEYEADLFVDASGFQRILAKKIPEFKWQSMQDDMFVNSAFAFPCPHEGDNYRCFTTAKAMKNGWMWRIPTYTRMGNGYAYNDNFTTFDEAVQEVKEVLGFEPDVKKQFKFEAGYYNKTWHKNVVLIGLSSHFFEPLEATAIGVGLEQAKALAIHLPSRGFSNNVTDGYNREIQNIMRNMFEFIRLHYVNCREDTPFWKHVAERNKTHLPENIKKYIDIAQYRVLQYTDIGVHTDNNIFYNTSWNTVLYSLDLLPKQVASDYLNGLGNREIFKHMWENGISTLPPGNYKKHREFIEEIVNENSIDN